MARQLKWCLERKKLYHADASSNVPVVCRFNDIGFDDNMVGLSAGSQNVCLLAAFGNGGVVLPNCVPIIGTQASCHVGATKVVGPRER